MANPLAEGLTWAALSIGIAARLLQYWRQPSLWVDESMLALAIGTRRFTELAMPLEYGQMAPVGFNGIEWLALEVFGSDERALRLVPMVSGIIGLLLLTILARRVLSPAAAAVVVIGAALSPALLRGANEVKPYSSDAAIGLAIIVVALRIVEHPSSLRHWIYWGVTATVGAIGSFPSILVSGATGLALLPIALHHRRLPVLGGLGALAVLVGAVAASAVRSADLDAYMSAFWAGEFLAVAQPLESLSKLGIVAGSIVARNVDRPGPAAVVFAVAAWAGAAVLARQAPRTAIMIVGPVALALGLAVTRTYPVSSRTWLFAAPLLLIGFGTLVDWVARRIPQPSWRAAAILTAAAVFLGPWNEFLIRRRIAIPRQDPKAPLAYLETQRHKDEPIYVFARAVPAWLWYQTDWNDPAARDRARLMVAIRSPGRELFHNQPWTAGRSAKSLAQSPLTTERGVELYGEPSGLVETGREAGVADPRWAVAERGRIEPLGARCVWLFASNVHAGEWRTLTAELDRVGWSAGPESGSARGDRTSRYCRPTIRPGPGQVDPPR